MQVNYICCKYNAEKNAERTKFMKINKRRKELREDTGTDFQTEPLYLAGATEVLAGQGKY